MLLNKQKRKKKQKNKKKQRKFSGFFVNVSFVSLLKSAKTIYDPVTIKLFVPVNFGENFDFI